MEPLISIKGKVSQLTYDFPHRVHDAKVYPVKAPNGSTVILYGHENGLRVLWRGGRPLKQPTSAKEEPAKPPQVNGTSNDNSIMIIDSDDDEPSAPAPTDEVPEEAEYESEDEEELDPAAPYPTFVQTVDLALNTEVLHLAVPQVPEKSAIRSSEYVPSIFYHKIVVSAACADYSVRVITLPLSPPSTAAKSRTPTKGQSRYSEEVIRIAGHAGHRKIPTSVDVTWTSRTPLAPEAGDEEMQDTGEEPTPRARRRQSRSRSRHRDDSEGWDLLIASHSTELTGLVHLWRLPIKEDSLCAPSPLIPSQTLHLSSPAARIAFNAAVHPKKRHSQLLIAETKGAVRVYDLFAPSDRRSRASRPGNGSETGAYIAAFLAPFESPKANVPSTPTITRRKEVLDAAWASDGRSIVMLLSDGEWGVWDFDRSGPKPPANPLAFAVRGFIGVSSSSRSSDGPSSPKRSNRPKLAPMTPNTRRTKEESLFQGSPTTHSAPAAGGISVAALQSTTGVAPEDSVVLWYGTDAYRIPNLGQFWARSIAGSGGGGLHGPGLSKISALDPSGEALSNIDQFATTTREARMAVPRDALVVAGHKLIILTTATAQAGLELSSALGERDQEDDEEALRLDQSMLMSGELDIGGVDRLLDNMADRTGGGQSSTLALGNPRRVLFAASEGE